MPADQHPQIDKSAAGTREWHVLAVKQRALRTLKQTAGCDREA